MRAGGGSGGSVHVTTRELEGDGVINTSGGNGYTSGSAQGGGGSGGRIAVYYVVNYFVGASNLLD